MSSLSFRRKSGIAVVTGTLLLVAAAFSLANDNPARQPAANRAGYDALRSMHWKRIGVLPTRFGRIQHAEIRGFSGRLWAAMIVAKQGRSTTLLLRHENGSWHGPVGGRRFAADKDVAIMLNSETGRLCLGPTSTQRAEVHCLTRGRHWRRIHSVAYPHEPNSVPVAMFAAGSRLVVAESVTMNASTPRRSLTVNGVPIARLFVETDNGWNDSTSDLTPAGHTTQHPQGFQWGKRFCLAINVNNPSIEHSQVAETKCLTDGSWQTVATPLADSPGGLTDVYSATSGPTPFLSILSHQASGDFNQNIYRLANGEWRRTNLGADSSFWAEQGKIYAFGSKIFTARFDHHASGAGSFTGRFIVRAFDVADDESTQVGQPLLSRGPIDPPFALSLAQVSDDQIYSLNSQYSRRRMGNELVVRRLISK